MFYKKSQVSTDTPIIISIIAFQTLIIVCLGIIQIDPVTETIGKEVDILGLGTVGFTYNIINNISYLGWANSLIFTPLIFGLLYIVLKLIRGGG